MGKTRQGVVKECAACKIEFYVPFYRKDQAKFCSHNCLNKTQYIQRDIDCKGCGKHFKTSQSRKKKIFCSLECRSAVAYNEKERRQRQKLSVIKLRGFSSGRNLKLKLSKIKSLCCEACGYSEYAFCLDVHHKDENPINNSLENLAVLCVMCHRKLHKGIITLKEVLDAPVQIA